jgi:succinoglycan biosynthesis protein ExoA
LGESDYPSVSVVMPVYNEAAFIERSLGAMLAQDYPGEIEVIVVDGMSEDDTRAIVGRIMAEGPRVRLLDNPRRIIPAAINIGVSAARHTLIARMDGHTLASPDYLRKCVDLIQTSGADCAGGRIEVKGVSNVGRAIAAAMESPFGVGTAAWHGASKPQDTDTVPFPVCYRARIQALGGYDERVLLNEDYEFNYRLRASGGRIRYSPDIVTTYYSRKNLRALWRQYFQYGVWKARVLKMHPGSLRVRHLAPPLFAAGLVVGAALLPLGALWRWLYAGALTAYGLLVIAFSLLQAARRGWRYLPILPIAFIILHTAWGFGFWAGVWRWWVYRTSGSN